MYDRGHRSERADRLHRRLPRLPRHDDRQHRLPGHLGLVPGAGRGLLSWVLDGYFVVIAALLVPAGGLADRFGHKRDLPRRARRLHRRQPALRDRALAGDADRLPGRCRGWARRRSRRPRWRSFSTASRPRSAPPGSASGAPPPLPLPRSVRPSAAALVELDRLAPGLPRQPAARRRGSARRPAQPPERHDSATAACPTCPGALMLALGLAAVDAGDRRGQRLGLDRPPARSAPSPPRPLLLAGVVVRSRTPPAPDRRAGAVRPPLLPLGNLGTLLFAAAFFSLILGNVLFLTSVWGYSVLEAGLADPARPGNDDRRRRSRRPPRRPLRPPRGDRARHALLRRRGAGPALRRGRARLARPLAARRAC